MTTFIASLSMALRALGANRMRSTLSMLGIIIGVGGVIAMIAVGSGAKARIAEQIASIGSNVLVVWSGSLTSGGLRTGAGNAPTLTADDSKAIVSEIPSVRNAAPNISGVAQVVFGNRNWSTYINGTTPEILYIRNWPLALGRNFSHQDVDGAAKVCLLGRTVVANLFGGIGPIGQIVRIIRVPFTVIGVLAPKGPSAWGADQDDVIFVPLTTAQKRLLGTQFPGMVKMILVQAEEPEVMKETENEIVKLLRQRHRIQPKQASDFYVRDPAEAVTSAKESARVMSLLLGVIASISLFVGGIGIMNIMLVSITERTREIGIRMAVGAKGRDILLQFLTESLVLSLIGGVLGIAAGIGGVYVLSSITEWPTLLSMRAILLSFLFAGSVGVFFGFYPARKASLLDPIEALRYE
jgi:putative ABC transport system permease protein